MPMVEPLTCIHHVAAPEAARLPKIVGAGAIHHTRPEQINESPLNSRWCTTASLFSPGGWLSVIHKSIPLSGLQTTQHGSHLVVTFWAVLAGNYCTLETHVQSDAGYSKHTPSFLVPHCSDMSSDFPQTIQVCSHSGS